VDALDGPDAVLGSLDPEQREVALVSRGPVCVLAGAGTGKTRAVAHRIAYSAATGAVDPARVLAPEAANSLLPDRPAGLRVPVWPGRAGWLAPVPAAVPR